MLLPSQKSELKQYKENKNVSRTPSSKQRIKICPKFLVKNYLYRNS